MRVGTWLVVNSYVLHLAEHLRPLLERNDKTTANFYKTLFRVQKTRSFKPKKLSPNSTKSRGFALLKPVYVCLQCQYLAPKNERNAHARKHGHRFCKYPLRASLPSPPEAYFECLYVQVVDSRTGEVYCQRCQDFVYDFNLERFLATSSKGEVVRNISTQSGSLTQEGLPEIDEEDAAYISTNTSKRSCGREGVRGLYNLGQTCYMNVILQTLLHDGFLTTYFLGNGHRTFDCTDEHCVSCALCETFAEFNNDENTGSICSLNVLHASWVASPEVRILPVSSYSANVLTRFENQQLGGNQQQDAHEFYQFLVDRLHCGATGDTSDQKTCDTDCTCFFHKAFFGKLRSSVTCLNCGNVTRKDDPIMDLSLAFQAQKHPDANGTMTTTRSLTGCLDSFTAPENLTYSCSRCGDVPQQATKQLQIGRLPLILCIQLKASDPPYLSFCSCQLTSYTAFRTNTNNYRENAGEN